jgi:hypothetical protein
MKRRTRIWLNIGVYTIWALGGAWTTTMAGVKWNSMGWEEKSCLIWGIIVTWTGTMKALFDDSLDRRDPPNDVTKP